MTNEERNLLKKMASGALDGFVGDELTTSGGSTFWKVIKNGDRVQNYATLAGIKLLKAQEIKKQILNSASVFMKG